MADQSSTSQEPPFTPLESTVDTFRVLGAPILQELRWTSHMDAWRRGQRRLRVKPPQELLTTSSSLCPCVCVHQRDRTRAAQRTDGATLNRVRVGAGVCPDLHDLDWTHVGAPFGLSSQERWLLLNQLDLQLFVCKAMESEVLQLLDSASVSSEFYRHRHRFWEGFPSLHQIPGTLLWEVRWQQSSEEDRRS